MVDKQMEEKGEKPVDRTGLEFSKEQRNNVTFYLLKFPVPTGVTEAYFVVVVKQDRRARYFTLELMFGAPDSQGVSPTVLGEWSEDRKHLNLGQGPKPTREDFIKAVIDKL